MDKITTDSKNRTATRDFPAVSRSERPAIGNMKIKDLLPLLELYGEHERAKELAQFDQELELSALIASGQCGAHPWEITEHQFAYLAPGADEWYLQDATKISPDNSLVGKRLKITLDKLRVYRYPGSGIHQILFDFTGNHQQANDPQPSPVHFSQTYSAQDGEGAGVDGYPIFVGLVASPDGIDFACKTINVCNQNDEQLLALIKSDVFNQGLQFIEGIDPALKAITGYAVTVAKTLLSRNENVKVQDFALGLDLTDIATRAKLREGSYIAAQAPDGSINWGQWKWADGMVRWWNGTGCLPYNYIVFSVSKVAD